MPDTDPKHVVQRLIADVMNQRNLGALDDIYTPRLAPAARRWVEPFLESFSDVQMRISAWGIEGHGAVMDAVPTSWQRPASQAARASWMSRRVRRSAAI
jgi:hypothetical protein